MKTKLIILICFYIATVSAAQEQSSIPGPGIPVDRNGMRTFDPTQNVLDLVTAAVRRLDDLRVAEDKRLDDLRSAEDKLFESKHNDLKELIELRSLHERELRVSEAGRLDSIRQVDRDDVAKTTAAANVAIATLAKQTTDLSTTLAKQVADTATASEARQAAFAAEVTKRLSALELGFSERQGKQTLSDPQLEILKAETERNTAARLASQGSTMGISNMWTLLVAAGVLIIAALNYFRSHQNGKILRNGRK